MENVKVRKDEALKILKANREAHKKIFLEAVTGYQQQAIELLEKHIANIKAGKVARVSVQLPTPEEHTKDYDRAIKMLEMSVEEVVEFSDGTFAEYIMDDWSWKRQFLASNSAYSDTAAVMFAQQVG